MSERSPVTGANGQDGAYLAEQLLAFGHDVHAMCHSAAGARRLLEHFPWDTAPVADLENTARIRNLIDETEPRRVFNLASNASMGRSWDKPAQTADALWVGPIRSLKAS